MKYKIFRKEDFATSTWQGGTTTQLAIYPEGSIYAERDFIWRLSSATVDLEESDFTALPDYNRVLLVLKGEVVLAYEGVRSVKLSELEYDYFDGAYKTKSFGKITDYNLMTRKDHVGKLSVQSLTNESQTVPLSPAISRGFFAKGGYAIISFDGENIMLKDGEQLVFEDNDEMNIGIMGEGALICTEIIKGKREIHDLASSLRQNELPPDKKRDLRFAYMLALTNFRGSTKVFKKLDEIWYDDRLYGAIQKIERLYLTIFLYIIGVSALAMAFINAEASPQTIGIGILAWTLLDLFVINPLIYYAILPKPAYLHIKMRAELSEVELEIQRERENADPRTDRILKKYKWSGKREFMGTEEVKK